MGFYLRKSLSFGPVRFNLSKSGIGVSAGVRGARVGVSATGRAYVHAGRSGLYFRQSLGSGRSSTTSRARTDSVQEGDVIQQATNVTYLPPSTPASDPLKDHLVRRKAAVAAFLLIPAAGVVVLGLNEQALTEHEIAKVIGFALLVLWPIPMWRGWRKNRAGVRFGQLLQKRLIDKPAPSDADFEAIRTALKAGQLTEGDRIYQSRLAYLNLVTAVVADGVVGDAEHELLGRVEQVLDMDAEFRREARVDAFRHVYFLAVADRDLTEPEEQALDQIRQRLDIPSTAVSAELDAIAQLHELRQIRNGQLPVVQPSLPLPESETCHLEAPGRLLKEKSFRTFQTAGQRYKVRGLTVDKEGTLYVTDKRILLVHGGTTSIRFDKILDVELDYDRNLLAITKDGSSTPVLITTPDCVQAGAMIAAAAGH